MLIYEKDTLPRTLFEMVFLNAGSSTAKEGVAFFLSHILNTKGTKEKKEKFYSLLEYDATQISVSVNKEYFSVSLKFLNKNRKKALMFFKELLLSANITEESFEKAKKEILAKIENKKNDNDYIASVNLYREIFKNTPLMHPVMGEKIQNITLNDVKDFYKSLFEKEVIFINGGEEVDIAMFDFIKPVKEITKTFIPVKSNPVYKYKNVEQSYIHFASHFDIEYAKELHLAKIATFVLGSGGFGSRMMEEIRVKRGYAYSAYTHNSFKKTHKLLNGYLQTKLENTPDALELVVKLIDEFYERGITQEELDGAKQFLIGSEPLRNETLTQRLVKKFNETYLNLPDGYYDMQTSLIKNTDLNEINSFIKKHPEIKDLTFSVVTKKDV